MFQLDLLLIRSRGEMGTLCPLAHTEGQNTRRKTRRKGRKKASKKESAEGERLQPTPVKPRLLDIQEPRFKGTYFECYAALTAMNEFSL